MCFVTVFFTNNNTDILLNQKTMCADVKKLIDTLIFKIDILYYLSIISKNKMNTTDTYICPRRLVMIKIQNNCMFCENPQGPSYIIYVYLEELVGYIYCANCKDSAVECSKYWNNNVAFGKANYLKEKDIQIKRTSGIIESGWKLSNPFIRTNPKGMETIHCYNKTQDLGRWCNLVDILDLNPPSLLE